MLSCLLVFKCFAVPVSVWCAPSQEPPTRDCVKTHHVQEIVYCKPFEHTVHIYSPASITPHQASFVWDWLMLFLWQREMYIDYTQHTHWCSVFVWGYFTDFEKGCLFLAWPMIQNPCFRWGVILQICGWLTWNIVKIKREQYGFSDHIQTNNALHISQVGDKWRDSCFVIYPAGVGLVVLCLDSVIQKTLSFVIKTTIHSFLFYMCQFSQNGICAGKLYNAVMFYICNYTYQYRPSCGHS